MKVEKRMKYIDTWNCVDLGTWELVFGQKVAEAFEHVVDALRDQANPPWASKTECSCQDEWAAITIGHLVGVLSPPRGTERGDRFHAAMQDAIIANRRNPSEPLSEDEGEDSIVNGWGNGPEGD